MSVTVSGGISGSTNYLNYDGGSDPKPYPVLPSFGSDIGSNIPRTNLPVTGTASVSGTATGGGQPHNNMPPVSFWNVMVKL